MRLISHDVLTVYTDSTMPEETSVEMGLKRFRDWIGLDRSKVRRTPIESATGSHSSANDMSDRATWK